jgi:hypothetical protein
LPLSHRRLEQGPAGNAKVCTFDQFESSVERYRADDLSEYARSRKVRLIRSCDGYRTDPTVRMVDNPAMPRYSFTLEDGVPVASDEATEDFANNQAAVDHAKLIAKDLARNNPARDHYRVVVRDEASNEIGNVPLLIDRR